MSRKEYGGQSPRANPVEDIDEILASGARLISSIYQEFNSSNRTRPNSNRHSLVRRNSSVSASDTSSSAAPSNTNNIGSRNPISNLLNSLTSRVSASTSTNDINTQRSPLSLSRVRADVDADLDRINRYCNNIDANLRLIGLAPTQPRSSLNSSNESDNVSSNFINTSTPARTASGIPTVIVEDNSQSTIPEIVDLSLYDFNLPDDGVIVVNSNRTPEAIIDLCTPQSQRRNRGHNLGARCSSTTTNQRAAKRRLGLENTLAVAETVVQAVGAARAITAAFGPRRSDPAHNRTIETQTAAPKVRRTSESAAGDQTISQRNEEGKNVSTQSDDEPYRCPICLENPRKREPTITKCGHIFCNSCISTALGRNRKCPMCNSKITLRQLSRCFL